MSIHLGPWGLSELQRRVAQMIRIGTVSAVDLSDAAQPTCVVSNGGIDTPPVPWVTMRAGNDAEFWCPEIGEQALVFSPFGDMAQGIALVGIFQTAFPSPGTNGDVHIRKYKDGAVVSYDRAGHHYLVDAPAGGSITLQVGSTSLVLQDGKATLAADQFEHVGQTATFDGQAVVKQLLTWLAGAAGSAGSGGGSNSITGGLHVVNGDVTADDISLKGHPHRDTVDGTLTSPALAS